MYDKNNDLQVMPVIADINKFDRLSGNWLERLVFNHRRWMMFFCLLLTFFCLWQVPKLKISASFEKNLPISHQYIKNYQDNRNQLRGLGDTVRIVVENTQGTVLDSAYLDVLAKINDEVFLLPGVDRAWQKSIWTSVVRWTEATEEGFIGGPVMPGDYNGSKEAIEKLRINIQRAGVVGTLVSNDYTSSMIVLPLAATDQNGNAVDYHQLSTELEKIRTKYESGNSVEQTGPRVKIYIVGYAKLVSDLIIGLQKVMLFFVFSAVIAGLIIYSFTRCLRSTFVILACSLIAVTWQLGILVTLGYELDPFSALVPFLIFAIGVSHGAQKMNGIMQDVAKGTHKLVAARYTFRRLFMAGLIALLADAVGFGVLMLIDIPAIRDLALAASIGVALLVVTNLLLLPVLLSYSGVSQIAAKRSLEESKGERHGALKGVWVFLESFTGRGRAFTAVAIAFLLGAAGYFVSLDLKTGDIDPGAPELRADSRYNMDDAYINGHYGTSSDVFAIMVKTPQEECRSYETLTEIDRLSVLLSQLPGVQKTESIVDTVRAYTSGSFEGNPKWLTISSNQPIIDAQISNALSWNSEFITPSCSLTPIVAYLVDHKADTLNRVVGAVKEFAAVHDTADKKFLLAAGNSGIQATTNIVVKDASRDMLLYVYTAVIILCAIAFRSWRAVIIAVLPLVLTSILAEALMVKLDIGMKVATLPVIALGVGIGVDYSLYLLSAQIAFLKQGMGLSDAYRRALKFTGKVVALVGVTLAAGVVTWAWSPIKFQADMGILLTFMFLVNMIASLILVPALSYFLLSPSRIGRGVVDDGHDGGTLPSEQVAEPSHSNPLKEAAV